ncbi:MAG: hypothetical protein MJ230_01840 [bacterium]|nr:hypothetical protein [bacterium]
MKKFDVVEKEINGTVYKAQFNGIRASLKAKEMCMTKDGRTDLVKSAEYLLEHVIVEPKGLDVDDFGDINELFEVTSFAVEVANGTYCPSADGKSGENKGEK